MGDIIEKSRVVDYGFIETRGLMRSRVRTVSLLAGMSVAASVIINHGVMDGEVINVIPFLFYVALALLGMFLHIGFLRTVVLGEPQEVGVRRLFNEGKRFVLRVYGFYAGAVVALSIVAIPVYIFLLAVFKLSDDVALRVVIFVLVMLFCRILIFAPLLIVMRDCNIIDALRKVRSIRYRTMPHLILLLLVSWGLSALIPGAAMQSNIVFNAVLSLVYALVRIAIDLGGVRVLLYLQDME